MRTNKHGHKNRTHTVPHAFTHLEANTCAREYKYAHTHTLSFPHVHTAVSRASQQHGE